MADTVFSSLLVHEAEVKRPRVTLDQDGAPATPVFDTLASGVPCRVAPLTAGSEDDLLGRAQDASHVLYLAPGDLRVADRIVLRPVRTTLAQAAQEGADELEVADSTGMAAGMQIEVGSGETAETKMIADVAGHTVTLRDGLAAEHDEDDPVSVLRQHEVLAVQDECGIGHHLRAVLKELG